nr:MAG TPA: hypothetical protein [Caudoviricetes sp.]
MIADRLPHETRHTTGKSIDVRTLIRKLCGVPN